MSKQARPKWYTHSQASEVICTDKVCPRCHKGKLVHFCWDSGYPPDRGYRFECDNPECSFMCRPEDPAVNEPRPPRAGSPGSVMESPRRR